MDQDFVEKIKLTRFGFRLKLIGFSTFLSWFGIVTSLLVFIGGITVISVFSSSSMAMYYSEKVILIPTMSFFIILNIPYLIMWTFLIINTNKRNIDVIESITMVYCYVLGAFEIFVSVGSIVISLISIEIVSLVNSNCQDCRLPPQDIAIFIIKVIVSTVYLIFACLKIHGIRLEKNKLLGIYLCFRYICFIVSQGSLILLARMLHDYTVPIPILVGSTLFFILDLGLHIILHSTRADRAETRTSKVLVSCSD